MAIIDFKPKPGKKQFSAYKKKEDTCSHLSIEVDESERQCYCRECGKQIDPFAWILILIKHQGRAESRLFFVEREIKRITEQYERRKACKKAKVMPIENNQ